MMRAASNCKESCSAFSLVTEEIIKNFSNYVLKRGNFIWWEFFLIRWMIFKDPLFSTQFLSSSPWKFNVFSTNYLIKYLRFLSAFNFLLSSFDTKKKLYLFFFLLEIKLFILICFSTFHVFLFFSHFHALKKVFN